MRIAQQVRKSRRLLLVRIDALEPVASEGVGGGDALAGVEGEHPVQQLKGRARHQLLELLPYLQFRKQRGSKGIFFLLS